MVPLLQVDATQLEINPLVETDDGRVIAVDAKINFDDNASFRQKEIFALDDVSATDPREVSKVMGGLGQALLKKKLHHHLKSTAEQE